MNGWNLGGLATIVKVKCPFAFPNSMHVFICMAIFMLIA